MYSAIVELGRIHYLNSLLCLSSSVETDNCEAFRFPSLIQRHLCINYFTKIFESFSQLAAVYTVRQITDENGGAISLNTLYSWWRRWKYSPMRILLLMM